MKIDIQNCNNIMSAHIQLEDNKLNIKYAMNGTGKSTIANVIGRIAKREPLQEFKPFGEDVIPSGEIDKDIQKVLLFNEDFVNTVVFKESNVIQNAFEVFIKTPRYDELNQSIEDHLKSIHLDLSGNQDLNGLHSIGSTILSKVSFTNSGQLKQTGLVKNVMNSKSIFKLPEPIKKFQPLMDKDYSTSWVDWKNEGAKFDDNGICPFCTTAFDDKYEDEKKIFAESYKKSNVASIKELLSYFEGIKDYIDTAQYEQLCNYIKDCNDEETMKLLLTQFCADLQYLVEKIKAITEFDSYRVKREELSDLAKHLECMLIDGKILKMFSSEKVLCIINDINDKIKTIIKESEELKKEMGSLKGFINSRIEKASSDINTFLDMAAISYHFEMQSESNKNTKTILKYVKKDTNEVPVDNIRLHLSWGERNAFALILFMHHALSQSPDLIILDDPISSFDTNKKYAIINRLFLNTPESLYKKSVIMLTHDFQPIIDFVINNKPNGGSTNADFLINKNGIITELKITNNDIKPLPRLLSENASNDALNIVHRIICLRKFIEQTERGVEQEQAYNLLSCLVHGKASAVYSDDKLMDQVAISQGENFVRKYIKDFNFNEYSCTYFNKDYILKLYNDEKNNYYKLQSFRVLLGITNLRTQINDDVLLKYIDEQFHVENDYIFYLDLNKYDIIPDFVIPKCDEFLESKKAFLSVNSHA